eukprot:s1306_g28.t1
MAQHNDRWASKILSLPIFSDDFAKAVLASPYANLALISAMEVRSASEFVVQVHEWASSLDEEVSEVLLMSSFMLEQYWSLASSIEKAFFESTALQLGFGMCDPVSAALSAEAARARHSQAMKSLLSKPALPPRKILKKTDSEPTSTPLPDMENAARWKWAAKLEEIGKKAGSHSKLLQDTENSEGLSQGETMRLRQLVLSSGAPRTMAAHISAWERFEEWLVGLELSVFPLTHDKILKYALYLDQRECGPTVVPSFRTAVKWVTSKLAIDCPDLSHPALLAVQAEIVQKRAATLKEAVPIPIEAIGCMELFVTDDTEPEASRIFVWWWLCMVFASLRFDEAVHVKPKELIITDEGLFDVAWQTKVERKRRGTKELNTRDAFRDCRASYQRSLQWLKFFAKYALNKHFYGEEATLKKAIAALQSITAHSARATLLDAAVHAGPLVLKYTRNRTSVPAQMIQQLVKDMVDQEHPFEPETDQMLDDVDEASLDEVQFFVKTVGSRASQDFRYHCSNVGDHTTLACGRLQVEECTMTGSVLPDVSVLCKHCARARPDVASRCFTVAPASS